MIIPHVIESLAISNVEWDDLRAPATGVNPPGLASDPTWDTTNVGWLFSPTTDNILHIVMQLPHSWAEGTELRPHVHWEKTTGATGTVQWTMAYQISAIGQARTLSTTIVADQPTTPSDIANVQQISNFPAIDMAGYKVSTTVLIQLYRDVSEDDYAANARLLEFDLHFQANSKGSAQEFIKDPL